MSGFFRAILQGVLGGGQQKVCRSAILQQVLNDRDGNNEGIAAIISKLQSAGLGQQVQSWIGSGPNASVSADQIGQAFPQHQIDGWAQQTGTTPDQLRDVLAKALPHVVVIMSNGEVPAQTSDLSGLLGDRQVRQRGALSAGHASGGRHGR